MDLDLPLSSSSVQPVPHLDFDLVETVSDTDDLHRASPPKDVDLSLGHRLGPAASTSTPEGFSVLSFATPSPSPSFSSSATALDTPSSSTSSRGVKRRRVDIDIDRLAALGLPEPAAALDLVPLEAKLVLLDSDFFKAYISGVERQRPLSGDEEPLVRTLTRRIRNRESARRARQGKKDNISGMEERISDLARQLQETKLEVAALSAQNEAMRSEIAYSQQLIGSNPVLLQLYADVRAKHLARRAALASTASPSSSAPSS